MNINISAFHNLNTVLRNQASFSSLDSNAVTGRGSQKVCETSRLPHFLGNTLRNGGVVISLMHLPPFTPREDSWYSFLLEAVNPRVRVQLEGLGQLKSSVTSSGIEPVILRLVAHCHNQLHYLMPLSMAFVAVLKHDKIRN
jgi:hypothetical protein